MTRVLLNGGAVPIVLGYAFLSLAFCYPLFQQPFGLGVTDWDQHIFYYGSVIRNAAYGQLPFWNPWYCGGNVLWQNPQVSLISPAYPLAAVMPLALAMKVNVVLHYGIGFAGMHLLLRRVVGLRSLWVVAYLASLFVFSGSLALHLNVGHTNFLPAFFLPLMLYAFLRAIGGSPRHAVLAGAVLAASLLSGGLHIAPMAAVLFGLIAILALAVGRTWTPALVAAAVFAIGLGLAAPKLVPTALFVTGSDLVDTRNIHHPDRMTVDMLWHALTDGYQNRSVRFEADVQKYGWWEYGNYVGWFGAGLGLVSIAWLLIFRRRRDHWLPLSMAMSLVVLIALALGEFSELAPAPILGQLPIFSSFRVPSRFIVLIPLVGAMSIAFALRDTSIDAAPPDTRGLIVIGCLVAVAQLGYANSAQLKNVFSLPPLGLEHRLYERAESLQVAAEPTPGRPHDSPMFRSLLEGVSTLNCYEPLQLARTAVPGEGFLVGEGPVSLYESTFSPNRVSARVVVGRGAARLTLNQAFSPGWTSSAGPVVRAAGGRPSVVLPAGFAGRVSFTFVPPGLWYALVIFAGTLGVSVLVWRRDETIRESIERVDRTLSAVWTRITARIDLAQVAVLLIAAGGFVWTYSHYPYRPTTPANGWWNYWDQGQYLRSARALAHGNWTGAEHWYPIGYPLVAAPFVEVLPRDPFLPVNFAAFVAFTYLCYRLFRQAIGGWGVIIPLFLALAYPAHVDAHPATSYPLWSQFAVPWNSNPVAAAYVAALLGIRAGARRQSHAINLGLGALLGLVAVTRPTDAIPLGAMVGGYAAWSAVVTRRVSAPVMVAAGTMVCLVPALLFMQAAYGGPVSPYVAASRTIGFSLSDVHQRLYQILLRSEETYGESGAALFQLQPWLYVAVPLAVAWAFLEPRSGALPVGLALSSWLLYIAYNDLSPFNLVRFLLVHYIVWTLPVLACAAVAGARNLVTHRRWRTCALIASAAMAVMSLRLAPQTLEPARVATEQTECCITTYVVSFASRDRIDAIDVSGVSHGNPVVLSGHDAGVVADAQRLGVFSGYQVLRRPDGVRIMFNRHLEPAQIAFTLDESFQRTDTALRVMPLRFIWTLRWPFA